MPQTPTAWRCTPRRAGKGAPDARGDTPRWEARIARTGVESRACAPAASPGPATHLDHVQLGHAVLLHGHRQGDPVLFHEHLGVQAFPSMGNCALGLLGKVL